MGTNRPWNWRFTVIKTIKMMLIRPPMTNFKMTVRADYAVSTCNLLLPPIKALAHWLSVAGSRPLDRSLPSAAHPQDAGLQNKANFPFHQLASFFFFLIFIYLYLFLAVLGLRFCATAFSSCRKREPLFIVVRGPLTVVASLVAEHTLQIRRLSSCGSRT